jgi:hypothetical protein
MFLTMSQLTIITRRGHDTNNNVMNDRTCFLFVSGLFIAHNNLAARPAPHGTAASLSIAVRPIS